MRYLKAKRSNKSPNCHRCHTHISFVESNYDDSDFQLKTAVTSSRVRVSYCEVRTRINDGSFHNIKLKVEEIQNSLYHHHHVRLIKTMTKRIVTVKTKQKHCTLALVLVKDSEFSHITFIFKSLHWLKSTNVLNTYEALVYLLHTKFYILPLNLLNIL